MMSMVQISKRKDQTPGLKPVLRRGCDFLNHQHNHHHKGLYPALPSLAKVPVAALAMCMQLLPKLLMEISLQKRKAQNWLNLITPKELQDGQQQREDQ